MDLIVTEKFYVYVHTRPNSLVPFYVGKGCGKRWHDKKQRGTHWKNCVKKNNGFCSYKIIDKIDDEFAFLVEKELIAKLKAIGIKLCNMTNGGEGQLGNSVNKGISKSKEHKEKLRQVNLGKKQSHETIKKRLDTFKKRGFVSPKFSMKTVGGEKNVNFKGYYHTPKGKYPTYESAAKANQCTVKQVRIWTFGNKCVVKSKLYVYPPKQGWTFEPKD